MVVRDEDKLLGSLDLQCPSLPLSLPNHDRSHYELGFARESTFAYHRSAADCLYHELLAAAKRYASTIR
jgi:hypothetical protein